MTNVTIRSWINRGKNASCSTIYLILFEGYNLTLSQNKGANNKTLFKKYRMWRHYINIVNLKKLLKTILNDT